MAGRFNNKTNGITPRRWLLNANPALAGLISGAIGNDDWITDLDRLHALESRAADSAFQTQFRGIKRANKDKLAKIIRDAAGVTVNPDSLFDVQVKRMHAYKRQLLNVLRIIHEYLELTEDGRKPSSRELMSSVARPRRVTGSPSKSSN